MERRFVTREQQEFLEEVERLEQEVVSLHAHSLFAQYARNVFTVTEEVAA